MSLEHEISAVDAAMFAALVGDVAAAIYGNAVAHGWYENGKPNDGERIALMHSELSEALEGMRHGNPPSDKIGDKGFSQVEEELADCVIRILDYAAANKLNIAGAILAKHTYNIARPHKHGGKAF